MIDLGYDDQGKRIRKRVYSNSMPQLEKNILRLRKEYEEIRHPSDVSFGAYADKWISVYKSHAAINTRKMYEYTLKKFTPIRHIKLKDIRQSDLQGIINDSWDMPRTCQNIRLTAKQIFKAAIGDGILSRSPADKLNIPKLPKPVTRILTDKELAALGKLELGPMDQMFVDVMYTFGLRPGEALALMFSDFEDGTLTVSRAVAFDVNNPVIKDTKTGVTRQIPIPEAFSSKLKKYKAKVEKCLYLFHTKDLRPITKISYRRMWDRITNEMNRALGGTEALRILAKDFTPYLFRHSFATRLYYVQGVSMKQKAAILGHSEKMLIERYSHLDDNKEDIEELKKVMSL